MAESVVVRQSGCIEWKVKHLLSVLRLESETFSFNGSMWRLSLIKTPSQRIDIFLDKMNPKGTLSYNLRIIFFIEDKDRHPQFTTAFDWSEGCRVWGKFVSDLQKKEDILLTNGVARLVCMLMPDVTPDVITKTEASTQTVANTDEKACLENLSRDLHYLPGVNLLSDVTLKCGGHSISAHKNILLARSEVFLAKFRGDTIESKKGIIEIPDMQPSTLDQFAQYIYSGKVSELSADSVQQLYSAANKYDINSLKNLCVNFMKDNLTEENACSFLASADAHGDSDVKDYILSFIMETELLGNDDHWQKFLKEHPKLAPEVKHQVYKAKCSRK